MSVQSGITDGDSGADPANRGQSHGDAKNKHTFCSPSDSIETFFPSNSTLKSADLSVTLVPGNFAEVTPIGSES